MVNRPSTVADDGGPLRRGVPREPFERRTASAFVIGGALIIASLVAPIGLEAVTDWSWAAGIVLAGTGVIAAAVGLFGLYTIVEDRTPGLAVAGAVGAAIAGTAALGLITMVGIAIVADVGWGLELSEPLGLFKVLGLSVAAGLSFGFLSFGVATRRTGRLPRTAGKLLAGGVLLLAAVVGEFLRSLFGIGPPPWVILPVLVLVAVDALAIGRSLQGGVRRDRDG